MSDTAEREEEGKIRWCEGRIELVGFYKLKYQMLFFWISVKP